MRVLSIRHRWLLPAITTLLVVGSQLQAHAQTKPTSLAKYIPSTDLVFYLEFDGFNAHTSAWKKSAIYKLLNETKLGGLVEDLLSQTINQALTTIKGDKFQASEIINFWKSALQSGFALGLSSKPPTPDRYVVILRDAEKNGTRIFFDRLIKLSGDKIRVEKRGTRTLNVTGEGTSGNVFWYEAGQLIFTSANPTNLDPVIATLEGKAPNASTHPIRTELARPEPGLESALIAFLDFRNVPMPPSAAQYGLDGLKQIDYRWGFQDEALFSVLRVKAPSPRRGVLSWLDGSTFEKSSLPVIPAGLPSWTAFAFRPGTVWEKSTALVKELTPPTARNTPQMLIFEQQSQKALGFRINEDLLGQLGPKWVFYLDTASLSQGNAKSRGGLTVEIKDQTVFSKTLEKLITVINQAFSQEAARNPRGGPAVELRKLTGTTQGYRLILPPGRLPPGFPTLAPTILLGKKQMVIGLSEAEARMALLANASAKGRWTPGPDYKTPFAKLPSDLIILSVDDPRTTVPQTIANTPTLIGALNGIIAAQAKGGPALSLRVDPAKVPSAADISKHLFPGTTAVSLDQNGLKVTSREAMPGLASPVGGAVAVALILPAVQSAREAARRSQCVNNLKQIGLAMHNFHSTTDHFPAAAIVSKEGKPLLSWRVAILPYIEQQPLYNEFKLDEPWDSVHNKALISKMPTIYRCPSRPQGEPFTTNYLTFVGGGAMFDINKTTSMRDVTDGTSMTLAVVEATKAVPWTKPDDLNFGPNAPPFPFGAGSNHPGGFNALLADGSVRFIKLTILPETLRALITRGGNEMIQPSGF